MAKMGRRRGEHSQTKRVLGILRHLRERRTWVAVLDLANMFEVSKKQMDRDLDKLTLIGHNVQREVRAGRAHVYLDEGPESAISLSLRERYSLLAVRRVFDVMRDTPLYEDVQSIYGKVICSLPEKEQKSLADIGDRFVYVPDGGAKLYKGHDDVIDALLTAVLRRWRVRFRYALPRGQPYEGVLEPYAMLLYRLGLYVVGRPVPAKQARRSAPSNPVRIYAVERFLSADFLRQKTFTVPAEFSVDECFQGTFGIFLGGEATEVVVDFVPEVCELVKSRAWHPSQRLSNLRGGGVRLEMTVEDPRQVLPWVLGWGPRAVLRQPEDLAQQIRAELAAASQQYAEPPPQPARSARRTRSQGTQSR